MAKIFTRRSISGDSILIWYGIIVLLVSNMCQALITDADYNKNYNYYYDGEDYDYKIDPCDYHGSIQESHGCHKKKLPDQNMENLFGNLVKKCCFAHGFTETISESCEVINPNFGSNVHTIIIRGFLTIFP